LEKARQGSKTIKKYDKAKTPYQRVLESEHVAQPVKDTLTQQYQGLDPIALKEKIKELQEQLWKQAWTNQIVPVIDELALDEGEQQDTLANIPRFYRKPRKLPCKRKSRTRKDPFEHVHEFIKLELQLKSPISAKGILDKLIEKYPYDFCRSHLRTLQRRVNEIRIQQDNREERYHQLMVSKKSMTTASLTSTMDA
jgi:hypothetical protein